MTPELTALALSGLLLVAQFVAYAIAANREIGPGYTMSPRDREPSRAMSQSTARQGRAFENHVQWLPLFAIGILVIEVSGQNSVFTALCAWAFLLARVAYVPAYLFGLVPGRSLIWAAGFLASVLLLVAAFF